MARQEAEREVMPADFLVGERVIDPSGEDLGKLEEMIISAATGRVLYAIISFGGIFGLGEKLFALPWSMLRHQRENRCFVLPLSKEQLKAAPGFERHSWPAMDRRWERRIYRFYDQTP
ncbi:MAG: PRC-barrel domain-containing protein, partial [Desulfuromonadales bacterium]|nr:PRC-barrel domain-containing protein [Desulfuromonadales bacterium]